jgi:VanW like protein/Putative peptidoglycan binding domain
VTSVASALAPRRRWRAVAGAIAAAALAATAAVALELSGIGGAIADGVRVDGADLGGLSSGEAERTLERHARARAARPVLLVGPLRTVRTSGVQLHARADVARAVAAASATRVGPVGRLLGHAEKRELPLVFVVDPARVAAHAVSLGSAPALDAAVTVDANGVRVRPARAGRAVDVTALRARLRTLPPRIEVPTIPTRPRVTTAAAEAAARRVAQLAGTSRTIVVGTARYRIAPAELRAAIDVRRAENGFMVAFDPSRLERLLPDPTPARDARLRFEGERVVVVPAVPGRSVDAEATALALADPTRTTIGATVDLVPPRVTTQSLTALGIRERVSAFTTYYPPGQPRVVNIRRASAVIDGTILRPGATFSMNRALGERTLAKGYVPAPQIGAGNSFVDSVGGGISQVATMLYNGAFFAGLELVEHQPHSLYIDRYPPGREATISWGGPELIFRNDWPAAVLIKLEATASSITVRFFSSRLGRRVETETFAPYGHGGGGFTVEYTRRVYRGDRLRRNERYRVRYGVASGPASGR